MALIQFKRGVATAVLAATLSNGEPAWATDTKKLWIGDGVTPGGIEVVMRSDLTATLAGYLPLTGGTLSGNLSATGTITAIAAATQDAVRMAGRAGGSSSHVVTITPTTLTGSHTQTLPNLTGTFALTGAAQDVTFGTLSSTALTSTGGVAVGGALTGATTGAFSSTVTATGVITSNAGTAATPSFIADAEAPSYRLRENDAALDTKIWEHRVQTGGYTFRVTDDGVTAASTIWTASRTGATATGFAVAVNMTGARATFAGTDAASVLAGQVTIGGGVVRAAGTGVFGAAMRSTVRAGSGSTNSTTGALSGVSVSGFSILSLTGGLAKTLNDLAGGVDGQVLDIATSGGALTVTHNSGANQPILCPGDANLTITGRGGLRAVYHESFWRVIATTN